MRMVAATGNAHKLEEMRRILEPLGITLLSQSGTGVAVEPEETGNTFSENARIKALAVYEAAGMAAVADDSGICVDALDGAPGVFSARYGGAGLNDIQRTQRLLEAMKDIPDDRRGACFVSAICCVLPDGTLVETQGECPGRIAREMLGNGGFGYDPIFLVGNISYGQLTPGEKDRVSHRGRALRALYEKLSDILQAFA